MRHFPAFSIKYKISDHKAIAVKIIIRLMIICVIILALCIGANLLLEQKIAILFAQHYEIRGIDVSHHQDEIVWDNIPGQDIDFAYIKATEGSGFVDSNLTANYEGAKKAGIDYGFYHFVSFESAPESQLDNYKQATAGLDMTLLPAIDIEYYGNMEDDPPSKDTIIPHIKEITELFKAEYGVYPLIYTTQKFYYRYLQGELGKCPLWIRNVYYPPAQTWAMWQYTDRLELIGIRGKIDGDVTDQARYEALLIYK